MKALFRPYRFRRVHLAVVAIVGAVLVSLMLSYFDSIATRLEAMRVEQMLLKLEQHLQLFHQMRVSRQPSSCQGLLSQFKTDAKWLTALELFQVVPKNKWQFEPDELRMIYTVNNSDYFESPNGDVIEITLWCEEGTLLLKQTPYQWCRAFGFWGCRQW